MQCKRKQCSKAMQKIESNANTKSAEHHATTKQGVPRYNAKQNNAAKTTVLTQQQLRKREHCDAT